jgi:hypothetical protein
MALTFTDVARKIIKETISSAIFIDDKALENFKSRNPKNKANNDRTIKLFKDFKDNQCLLHPFKYTKKGWKKYNRFFLKNKDLLILDWQLVGEDHTDALKILDQAVSEKSLHFICVYTKETQEVVKNEINRFFLGSIDDTIKQQYRDNFINTDLDEFWLLERSSQPWEIFDTFINSIINAKPDDQNQQIIEFQNQYNLTQEDLTLVKNIDNDNLCSAFSKFKTIMTKDALNFSSIGDIYFKEDANTFYIDHTIIKIFEKDEVQGEQLYDSFVSSFLEEKNIFLSLMGLEMRNRFRENSAFVGKDFDELNEDAFFHHKNKNKSNPYIFFDFLREILKDQISSYLYEKDLNLFDVLSDYYNAKDGENRQATFLHDSNKAFFIDQTFKLNNFYNRLNKKERLKNDILRFGDIFKTTIVKKAEDSTETFEEKYYLCVTPHCDCLNPKKIDNQFWFIEGKISADTIPAKIKILSDADGYFISFVKIEKSIQAIYWENSSFDCKPKSFFIENNNMISGKLAVEFNRLRLEFMYIESLKENYTQRLANKAFGYPMRVGIDFVKR